MGQLVPQSVRIAYLNLLRNRRRSVLSALIITIAVFALTSAGGFGLYTPMNHSKNQQRGIRGI